MRQLGAYLSRFNETKSVKAWMHGCTDTLMDTLVIPKSSSPLCGLNKNSLFEYLPHMNL
jgi:hypothetical protein